MWGRFGPSDFVWYVVSSEKNVEKYSQALYMPRESQIMSLEAPRAVNKQGYSRWNLNPMKEILENRDMFCKQRHWYGQVF